MANSKAKRDKLLVLSHFQRWFLKVFVSYTAMFLAIFGIGIFIWFRVLLNELLNLAGLLSETFLRIIQKHMILGGVVTCIFIVVLIAMAALQALFFSRRIAGPVFSLARHLERCQKKGKLEPWALRKGDLFEDLVVKFNAVVETVNKEKAK